MTSAGFGPTYCVLWDKSVPGSWSSRTPQGSLLGGEESSPSLPAWGTWDASGVLRQAEPMLTDVCTLEPATVENVTSLLPTPAASQGGYNQSDSPGAAVRPQLPMLVRELLPSPTAKDAPRSNGFMGPALAETVTDLLPTPTARDPKGGDVPMRDGGPSLPQMVTDLLPTPTAHLGTHGGGQEGRYDDPRRSNDVDDLVLDLLSRGDATSQPSDAMREPSDVRLPGL